jgi:hypothetical protein
MRHDKQWVYETLKAHFSKPGARLAKIDPNDGGAKQCFYRHPDDPCVKCAAGVLIRDEDYTSDWEGLAFNHKFFPYLSVFEYYDINAFLTDCQMKHDTSETTEEFLEKLEDIWAREPARESQS